MDDSEITALAKGMVPFVRECVAEAYSKITVPPGIAEQVANAVRLLHESPPIMERIDKQTKPPSQPRISRIERDEDGNLVPVYDKAQP